MHHNISGNQRMFLLRVVCFVFLGWATTTSHGFLSTIQHTSSSSSISSISSSISPTTRLYSSNIRFQQQPGESDIAFIKRLTKESAEADTASNDDTEVIAKNQDEEKKPKKGKYQRIEEWDAERKANGELSWEEKVMFDGQQHGNQVRQNDILSRNLHKF
jgi:hypothetical protein